MTKARINTGADSADEAGVGPSCSESTLGEILAATLRPPAPILAAGRGDCDALRELASNTYRLGSDCTGIRRIAELAQALTFARLAAVGGTPDDLRCVVFLYGQLAAECRAVGDMVAGDAYEGQGYFLASVMADDGDEVMFDMTVVAASVVSPGAHVEAKRLREVLA